MEPFYCKFCGYHIEAEDDFYSCPTCGVESCSGCAGACGCEVEEEDEEEDE